MDDECERCGLENGHTTQCWRAQVAGQYEEDRVKLCPVVDDDPPF